MKKLLIIAMTLAAHCGLQEWPCEPGSLTIAVGPSSEADQTVKLKVKSEK